MKCFTEDFKWTLQKGQHTLRRRKKETAGSKEASFKQEKPVPKKEKTRTYSL